jgi:two-component system, OmpR family, sensor kinase
VSRLPIRLRLTLAFTVAMALVLAATSVVLYLRLGSTLDEAIDDALDVRAAELAALAERGELPLAGRSDDDEQFIQLLDLRAAVLEATPSLRSEPLLRVDELPDAAAQRRFERDSVPGIEGRARALAVWVGGADDRRVLVVGSSLEDRDEALAGLLGELALVEPVALLLAALLAYVLATAALRPIEAMRAEAAVISAAEPGRRLSLPPAADEVSRLGETLNAMLGRLEAALERERSFVAEASHELRTPLALLETELELALSRPRTGAELEAVVRSAASETDRLVRLAEDLLVLARVYGAALPLLRAEVSVPDLFATVARRFGARAEETGRALEVDAPAGLIVAADSIRLEQAVGNLVENAFRHGGGAVRLVARSRPGAVELHVEDEGPGFPPEFLPRAFERFGRAAAARSGVGAGLGLPIAEVIATAHGGTAAAANRPGGGADVWLTIPSP